MKFSKQLHFVFDFWTAALLQRPRLSQLMLDLSRGGTGSLLLKGSLNVLQCLMDTVEHQILSVENDDGNKSVYRYSPRTLVPSDDT